MELLNNPILHILASSIYCHLLVTKIPKGLLRLVSLLPIFYLFSTIPWLFSSSTFLRSVSSFFLTWIASFKLLSFAFHRGPLVDNCPQNALDFAALTVFPLRINQNAAKTGLSRYQVVRFFDRPYMATSLQEFWGRRWNLMSSYILRVTVYDPTREFLKGVVGAAPGAARVAAVVVTLVVSGVMHEVVFYYITCGMRPTWQVTRFFVLHGFCMVGEAGFGCLARTNGWKPVHPVASRMVTVGFVLVTSYWLIVLPVWTRGGGDCNLITKK